MWNNRKLYIEFFLHPLYTGIMSQDLDRWFFSIAAWKGFSLTGGKIRVWIWLSIEKLDAKESCLNLCTNLDTGFELWICDISLRIIAAPLFVGSHTLLYSLSFRPLSAQNESSYYWFANIWDVAKQKTIMHLKHRKGIEIVPQIDLLMKALLANLGSFRSHHITSPP